MRLVENLFGTFSEYIWDAFGTYFVCCRIMLSTFDDTFRTFSDHFNSMFGMRLVHYWCAIWSCLEHVAEVWRFVGEFAGHAFAKCVRHVWNMLGTVFGCF